MFFAAVICSAIASVSLYFKTFAFASVLAAALLLLIMAVTLKKYKYITVMLVVVIFAVSLYFQFVQISKVDKYNTQKVSGNFLVVSEPEEYDEFNIITLKSIKCDALPKNTKYLVFDYKFRKLKIGDIVDANIKVTAIDRYDEYRLYNYSNGIYATASGITISKTGQKNTLYNIAGNIRSYVKKSILSHFDGVSAGLLLALTTGDRTQLSDEFLANVKTTGISHVIVVSGMHLSIIMAAVFWCLDRLFYNRYIRSFLSVTFVVFIFAVCGFTMSITRAGAMFIIAGMAPMLNRDNDSLNSLLTAVVMVLIGAPFAIFNVSFQLSVLSTLAIIWVVPFYYYRLIERFNISSKFLKAIISISLCSFFAIIFTLPVTIKIFGFVSVVSPITNLLITYPVNFALVLSIISLALNALPIVKFIGNLIFFVAKWCADLIVITVNSIAELPITVAVLPKVAFWWSMLLIAIVVGYMYFYEYKRKRSDLNANSI